MPKVVLHLGLHKTGTTTLQEQFFPACSGARLLTTLHPEMRHFVQLVTKKDPIYFDREEAQKVILAALTRDKLNILSHERFSGLPYCGVVEWGLDHRSGILSNLGSVFPDAAAILVLRRQDSLARSLYRQYLYSGGTSAPSRFYGLDSVDRPPELAFERFLYSRYVEAVKNQFSSGVLVLTFEEFVRDQKSFLSKLTGFMGVSQPSLELKASNTTRLGPLGMEITRLMNHLLRNALNRGVIPSIPIRRYGQLRRATLTQLLHDYWPCSDRSHRGGELGAVSDKILAMVADDNRRLDQMYDLALGEYGYY